MGRGLYEAFFTTCVERLIALQEDGSVCPIAGTHTAARARVCVRVCVCVPLLIYVCAFTEMVLVCRIQCDLRRARRLLGRASQPPACGLRARRALPRLRPLVRIYASTTGVDGFPPPPPPHTHTRACRTARRAARPVSAGFADTPSAGRRRCLLTGIGFAPRAPPPRVRKATRGGCRRRTCVRRAARVVEALTFSARVQRARLAANAARVAVATAEAERQRLEVRNVPPPPPRPPPLLRG